MKLGKRVDNPENGIQFQAVARVFHFLLRVQEGYVRPASSLVEAVRNVMAHADAREGKWRGNMRLERVATTLALRLGTWSIHGLPANPHSSTVSSRLNWLPHRFKLTRPFLWKTKSGFCACAITFQTCSTSGFPPGVKGAVFGGHTTNTVYRIFTLGQSMKSHEGNTGIVSLFLGLRFSIGVGN